MADTLRELAQRYPGNGLVLLLGSDQFAALSTWHEPETVARLARIAVARRPGVSPDVLADVDADRIEMPQVDISSSMIRGRVAAGRPIRHLVPDPVRELIEAKGLYRSI
jgi:nicotinate-nucleotide adenylyltransferase